ncbi:MAG: hypothetical protein WBA46_03690 [Thermomicrobiales bacterium]
MSITGDFFIGGRIPTDALRTAIAHALRIDPSQIGTREMGSGHVAAGRVVLVSVASSLPGDYADQYIATGETGDSDRFERVLSAVARELGVPVLIGAGLDDPDIMSLITPDGTRQHVFAEQDEDDGGIRNTPEMRRLIEQSKPASSRAA